MLVYRVALKEDLKRVAITPRSLCLVTFLIVEDPIVHVDDMVCDLKLKAEIF